MLRLTFMFLHLIMEGIFFLPVLSKQQFESFLETKNGICAYIKLVDWNLLMLKQSLSLMPSIFVVSYTINEIPIENWNALWESSYHPIVVGDYTVRAPFSSTKNTPRIDHRTKNVIWNRSPSNHAANDEASIRDWIWEVRAFLIWDVAREFWVYWLLISEQNQYWRLISNLGV